MYVCICNALTEGKLQEMVSNSEFGIANINFRCKKCVPEIEKKLLSITKSDDSSK